LQQNKRAITLLKQANVCQIVDHGLVPVMSLTKQSWSQEIFTTS